MRTTWDDLLRPGLATDFFGRAAFPAFDPSAAGYSAGNALCLMELSRLVYRHDVEEESNPPQPTRASFLAKAGFRQRFFISKKNDTTDTQAMLVESVNPPSFAALVFRGTENAKDFITDLETWQDKLPQDTSRVHHGFEKAIDLVWNEIEAELLKLSCPVYYTGHSLGAALATLAAARRTPHALYTFGSPLVGNAVFADSLANTRIYRVVDDKDAVARVPPEFMGFQHAGELHLLTERTGWSVGDIVDRVKRLFDGPPKNLADHAPVNYVDRIGQHLFK